MSCEVCGVTESLFPDHFEDHVTPPREMDICRPCHVTIHTSIGKKRSGKYPRHIRKVNALKQSGKQTHYNIVLPKQWVEQNCPNLELYHIIVGNIIIGVPSNREDLLRKVVSLLPRLMDVANFLNTTGQVASAYSSPCLAVDATPEKVTHGKGKSVFSVHFRHPPVMGEIG